MSDEFKHCVICNDVVNPRAILDSIELNHSYSINDTLSDSNTDLSRIRAEQRPLLGGARSSITSWGYWFRSWISWVHFYGNDYLLGTAVYYRTHNLNGTFFYCEACGPRVDAQCARSDLKLPQNVQTQQALAFHADPDLTLDFPAHLSPIKRTSGAHYSPKPSRPFSTPHTSPAKPRGKGKHSPPRATSVHVAEDPVVTLADELLEQEYKFDKNIRAKYAQRRLHELLRRLSPEYARIATQAEEKRINLRTHFISDQWCLSRWGIFTYPRSYKVIDEVKRNLDRLIAILSGRGFAYDLNTLAILSPLLWSMQYITPRGIEMSMNDADPSWSPYQRTRMIMSTIMLLALLAAAYYTYHTLKSSDPSGAPSPPPSPLPTPSPTASPRPSPTYSPTPSMSSSSSMSPSPTPTPVPPTPPPPTPPPPPPPPPTPPPPTPPPPTGPNCDLPNIGSSAACAAPEQNHWQQFVDIVSYNLKLPNPIVTVGDMINACPSAKSLMTNMLRYCYPTDNVLAGLIGNAASTMQSIAQHLAAK